jgi:hypothetical protein
MHDVEASSRLSDLREIVIRLDRRLREIEVELQQLNRRAA